MKLEKEITVKVNCDYEELHNQLLNEDFEIVEEYQLNDVYMIPTNVDIKAKNNVLNLLKKCILIRDVVGITKKIVYKYKKYDTNDNIIEQGKTECEITDIDSAIKLFKAINYKILFKIFDKCIIYANKKIELAVQIVNNKYIFIEIEDKSEHVDKTFNTTEEMIRELEKYNLDYDKNNYFVKKAEIIFHDTYK